jgi:hypothetical protein
MTYKTIDLRVLVSDDVDEEFFIRQLVDKVRGPGAPLGAALLVEDESDYVANDGCSDPIVTSHVYVTDDASSRAWRGEQVVSSVVQRTSTQLERVQALARRLYPNV